MQDATEFRTWLDETLAVEEMGGRGTGRGSGKVDKKDASEEERAAAAKAAVESAPDIIALGLEEVIELSAQNVVMDSLMDVQSSANSLAWFKAMVAYLDVYARGLSQQAKGGGGSGGPDNNQGGGGGGEWRGASSTSLRYHFLVEQRLLGTCIAVFVKQSLLPHISGVQRNCIATGPRLGGGAAGSTGVSGWVGSITGAVAGMAGMGGRLGNKGAVCVRFVVGGDTAFCFANAHMAAHRENVVQRNEEWKYVCTRKVFENRGPEDPLLTTRHSGGSNGSGGGNGGSGRSPFSPTLSAARRRRKSLVGFIRSGPSAALEEKPYGFGGVDLHTGEAGGGGISSSAAGRVEGQGQRQEQGLGGRSKRSAIRKGVGGVIRSRSNSATRDVTSRSPTISASASSGSSNGAGSSSSSSSSSGGGGGVYNGGAGAAAGGGAGGGAAAPTAPPSSSKPVLTLLEADVVFFMGDLNYRIKEGVPDAAVFEMIQNNDIDTLRQLDQLTIEREEGRTFVGFYEGPLCFPPTYKYIPGTLQIDNRPEKKTRTPSWCDRVLWSVGHWGGSSVERLGMDMYWSSPLLLSDHLPVSALFNAEIRLQPSSDCYFSALAKTVGRWQSWVEENVTTCTTSKRALDFTRPMPTAAAGLVQGSNAHEQQQQEEEGLREAEEEQQGQGKNGTEGSKGQGGGLELSPPALVIRNANHGTGIRCSATLYNHSKDDLEWHVCPRSLLPWCDVRVSSDVIPAWSSIDFTVVIDTSKLRAAQSYGLAGGGAPGGARGGAGGGAAWGGRPDCAALVVSVGGRERLLLPVVCELAAREGRQ